MSLQLHQREYWIFDMDGTLTLSIHDFDAIKRELSLPLDQPILEALTQVPEPHRTELHRQLDEIELEVAQRATAQSVQ